MRQLPRSLNDRLWVAGLGRTWVAGLGRSVTCWSFETRYTRGQISRGMVSSAGQNTVSQGTIGAITLPLAPCAEQVEIARCLDSVEQFVARIVRTTSASHSSMSELDQAILARAFRGDLVPQDPDDEPASKLLERIRAARPEKPTQRKSRRGRKPKPAPPQLAVELSPGHTPASEPQLPAADLRDPLHRVLLGHGPLERDAAIRLAAAALREAGTVDYRRLRRGGPLYTSLDAAVDAAVDAGLLDEPIPGEVRAVLANPRDYTPEHWRQVLLKCLGDDPVERADAIEASAYWAGENVGLEFQRLRKDGVIVRGLESAIDEATWRGDVERVGSSQVRAKRGDSR